MMPVNLVGGCYVQLLILSFYVSLKKIVFTIHQKFLIMDVFPKLNNMNKFKKIIKLILGIFIIRKFPVKEVKKILNINNEEK